MFTPALYYPYIHFRDVDWLKTSLLYFQQIKRIVPQGFTLNDPDEVRELRDQTGLRGEPLIKEESPYQYAVHEAEKRLLCLLEAQPARFFKKFTHAESLNYSFGGPFEMHRGKMVPLVDFLFEHKLAWPAERARNENSGDWIGLHPKLGEAIMSIIAIAIAKDQALGIVTHSGAIHRALAAQDESLVFDLLTKRQSQVRTIGIESMRDELAMTVLTSAFDVSRLTAKQVAELVREGKDLGQFKQRLDEEIKNARSIPNDRERKQRLQIAANEIINEWNSYRKTLPRYMLDALMPLPKQKLPSIVLSLITTSTTYYTLGAGVGLGIGFLAYAGINTWHKYKESEKHPLNYLSKIKRKGAILVFQG